MPVYTYKCNSCESAYRLAVDELNATEDSYESSVLFETSHSMNPKPEELARAKICPRCNGVDTEKTIFNSSFHTFIRGYGWLDKSGVARDRHIHKLLNDDPYAQYRTNGEVDHIKENLQKKGKIDKGTQYFTSKGD